MVVDTSAVVAVVLGEDDAERYARALDSSTETWMSAANVIEASIVVEARQGRRLPAIFSSCWRPSA